MLFLVAIGVCPASGQVFIEDFNDNVRSPFWSEAPYGSGPIVNEINQRLEITLPDDSFGSEPPLFMFANGYGTVCVLEGDFDIQVDYQLLTWPSESGAAAILLTEEGSVTRASYPAMGGEQYLVGIGLGGPIEGQTPTSDLSGQMRQQRSGGVMTGYYFSQGAWVPFHSWSATGVETATGILVNSTNMAWSG
jgi:hypothetical protein